MGQQDLWIVYQAQDGALHFLKAINLQNEEILWEISTVRNFIKFPKFLPEELQLPQDIQPQGPQENEVPLENDLKSQIQDHQLQNHLWKMKLLKLLVIQWY